MKWEDACPFSNAFSRKRSTRPWHIFISCTADKAVLETSKVPYLFSLTFLIVVQPRDLKVLKNKIGINAFMLGDVQRSLTADCSGFHNHHEI